jgi:hypothetical protein
VTEHDPNANLGRAHAARFGATEAMFSSSREAAVEKFTAASSGTHPRTALDVTAATEGVLDAIPHNARARGWSTKMVDDGPQSP